MIEFDSVTKRYPDGTMAVDGLSVTAPSHRITVFVGPSGCGKTTSLRMINRMIDPTEGRITIDGEDVSTQPPALLRRSIGYVIQHGGLFPHRTVLDNVATVPVLSGTTRRAARAAALDLLDRVGLSSELGDRYPAQLSGGQQQRVGVARALAADPPVLLMDEPFSAVDPVVREDLQNELLRLQADLAKTIVMVTHDIDEAIKLGDRVAVFAAGGRIAQYDTPEDLLANPADGFVRGFVGRDRGYRGLSFADASEVPVAPVGTEIEGLTLLRDADGRPTAWRGPAGEWPVSGTFTVGDSVRRVADLVLLSPASAAVRVDGAGRADGIVGHARLAAYVRDRQLALLENGEPV
ncbi:ATP-binding cassette domain-containing protein [Nocardioides sp. GY 10113]|uniref:ABC transporter ATP-binding protein n=1 Tax=Nocardioides sp. GY 10113 TaxID=2569761 RepID=UPI0010A91310|nr:ATP-binding cassette domain-containing protein [Nocardioides sp. GY 10113]